MTALILIQPLTFAVAEAIKKIFVSNKYQKERNVPRNPLTAFLWQFLKDFSIYVTIFMICTNPNPIFNDERYLIHIRANPHPDTLVNMDWLMNKHFWRTLLQNSGAIIPKELGHFKNGKLTMNAKNKDVVIKINNGYMGLGDKFLQFGRDFILYTGRGKYLAKKSKTFP